MTAKKKAPKAPVKKPVETVEVVKPVRAPKVPVTPVKKLVEALPDVMTVTNVRGQTLQVNKAYYLANSYKLTLVKDA